MNAVKVESIFLRRGYRFFRLAMPTAAGVEKALSW